MYLQIAQRSPRMIAAMNCVSTIVSTSTFASINSWAKCLFSVASEIGLPSLPLMRRQTRSCHQFQDTAVAVLDFVLKVGDAGFVVAHAVSIYSGFRRTMKTAKDAGFCD